MKVMTTLGLIEMDNLDVTDVVELGDNHRKVATEFRLRGETCPPECGNTHQSINCKLRRRDVAVSMLRGLSSEVTHGEMN